MSKKPAHDLPHLRQSAQEHAALLPPLVAEARHLAAAVVMGTHGRRQAGPGDEFWQFRPALLGDPWRQIDWRRSGRSDNQYIRQLEWQTAQSVFFWIDTAQSMSFSGAKDRENKAARAMLIGIAAAILLLRGGERVGLLDDPEPPRSGETQIDRIVAQLGAKHSESDYGAPAQRIFPKGSRAVFLSDFLGDWTQVSAGLTTAADRGVRGAVVQILDPTEEAFPFDGRTVFESMAGAIRFETLRAKGLRDAYLEKLANRKAALQELCAQTGWQYLCHHSDDSPQAALMWLYKSLERSR